MATESPTAGGWYGSEQAVSRLRGRLFELVCLGAALFGIAMVTILLVKVTLDATRPLSADPGWLATVGLVVVAPTAVALGYYALRDPDAGWVGVTAVGLPVFSLLVGSGIALLFVAVVSPLEWFGWAVALFVAGGIVVAHRRFRPGQSGVERTAVAVIVFWMALFGLPVVGPFPGVLSLREIVLTSPVLPTDLLIMLATFALPVAVVVASLVEDWRERRRDGILAGVLVFGLAGLAGAVGPLLGIESSLVIVLALSVFVPTGLYVETVLRQGEHVSGLWLPVVLFGGAVLAAVLTNALGFVGPAAWLDWQFLTSAHSRFPEEAGLYPAIVGSIMMMIVIIVGIFPIGVGAALYLEEYAPASGPIGHVVTLIEINIANLAGVPSVVYGLLGLALFINYLNMGTGTVIVGGMAVGLLILPIVIISSQEAIRAVPSSMRQASYGMGATKWQTIRNVVLPEAIPGILTGSILAFGRAIGETAPLLMIGAAAVLFQAPNSFTDKFSAMPRQIFAWASEPDPAFRYGVLAAGVVTLLVVLLSMNAAAILIRNRYQRRT